MPDASDLVLVLGGTGMLLPAVQSLLNSDHNVIVVARNPERAGTHPRLTLVQGDWSNPTHLEENLGNAIGQARPSKALLWIHSAYAEEMHKSLDKFISPHATVVQLLGSYGSDLPKTEAPAAYRKPRDYRQVVLGFAGPLGGPTRWLTDEEISQGALRAFDVAETCQLVGRIEPWSDRP